MSIAPADPDELVRARSRALTGRDFEALAGLCHAELRYTHSSGFTDTCDSYLGRCRSGFYAYDEVDCEVQSAVRVGETLILEERMRAAVKVDGSPRSVDTRALSVWVYDEGAWRFVAYHAAAATG